LVVLTHDNINLSENKIIILIITITIMSAKKPTASSSSSSLSSLSATLHHSDSLSESGAGLLTIDDGDRDHSGHEEKPSLDASPQRTARGSAADEEASDQAQPSADAVATNGQRSLPLSGLSSPSPAGNVNHVNVNDNRKGAPSRVPLFGDATAMRKSALLVLSRMNAIRAELGFPPWPATERYLEFAIKHPLSDERECFSEIEIAQIEKIRAVLRPHANDGGGKGGGGDEPSARIESKKRKLDSSAPLNEDDDSDERKEDEDDGQRSVGSTESDTAWTKVPWSDELKRRIPPTWFGPAKQNPAESEESRKLRTQEEPLWADVPLIEDEPARKRLLATNAPPVKLNACAGVKLPRPYDPKEELSQLKGRKGKLDSLLYRVLHKDIPASISRTTDVFRVVMCMLNSWENSSSEENFTCLRDVVVPLLLDNNIRSTDALQRVALNLAYDMSLPEDVSSTVTTSTASPLMRQHLDQASEKEKLRKSLKKASTSLSSSSSGTSSSSSYRGGKRRGGGGGGGGSARTYGFGRGSGSNTYNSNNKPQHTGRGGGGQYKSPSGGARGGSGGRGGRGRGGRGASSSSSLCSNTDS
jgi:hypothetical protein